MARRQQFQTTGIATPGASARAAQQLSKTLGAAASVIGNQAEQDRRDEEVAEREAEQVELIGFEEEIAAASEGDDVEATDSWAASRVENGFTSELNEVKFQAAYAHSRRTRLASQLHDAEGEAEDAGGNIANGPAATKLLKDDLTQQLGEREAGDGDIWNVDPQLSAERTADILVEQGVLTPAERDGYIKTALRRGNALADNLVTNRISDGEQLRLETMVNNTIAEIADAGGQLTAEDIETQFQPISDFVDERGLPREQKRRATEVFAEQMFNLATGDPQALASLNAWNQKHGSPIDADVIAREIKSAERTVVQDQVRLIGVQSSQVTSQEGLAKLETSAGNIEGMTDIDRELVKASLQNAEMNIIGRDIRNASTPATRIAARDLINGANHISAELKGILTDGLKTAENEAMNDARGLHGGAVGDAIKQYKNNTDPNAEFELRKRVENLTLQANLAEFETMDGDSIMLFGEQNPNKFPLSANAILNATGDAATPDQIEAANKEIQNIIGRQGALGVDGSAMFYDFHEAKSKQQEERRKDHYQSTIQNPERNGDGVNPILSEDRTAWRGAVDASVQENGFVGGMTKTFEAYGMIPDFYQQEIGRLAMSSDPERVLVAAEAFMAIREQDANGGYTQAMAASTASSGLLLFESLSATGTDFRTVIEEGWAKLLPHQKAKSAEILQMVQFSNVASVIASDSDRGPGIYEVAGEAIPNSMVNEVRGQAMLNAIDQFLVSPEADLPDEDGLESIILQATRDVYNGGQGNWQRVKVYGETYMMPRTFAGRDVSGILSRPRVAEVMNRQIEALLEVTGEIENRPWHDWWKMDDVRLGVSQLESVDMAGEEFLVVPVWRMSNGRKKTDLGSIVIPGQNQHADVAEWLDRHDNQVMGQLREAKAEAIKNRPDFGLTSERAQLKYGVGTPGEAAANRARRDEWERSIANFGTQRRMKAIYDQLLSEGHQLEALDRILLRGYHGDSDDE